MHTLFDEVILQRLLLNSAVALSVHRAQVAYVLLWPTLLMCCLTWRTHCTDSSAPTVLVILIKLSCQIWSNIFSHTPLILPVPPPTSPCLFGHFYNSVSSPPCLQPLCQLHDWAMSHEDLCWWFDRMAPECGSSKFKRSVSANLAASRPLSVWASSQPVLVEWRAQIVAAFQQNREGTVSSYDSWNIQTFFLALCNTFVLDGWINGGCYLKKMPISS